MKGAILLGNGGSNTSAIPKVPGSAEFLRGGTSHFRAHYQKTLYLRRVGSGTLRNADCKFVTRPLRNVDSLFRKNFERYSRARELYGHSFCFVADF